MTLEEKLERAQLEIERHRQQADDAVHVILECTFMTHEMLDLCGCEACERVRASMVEAGYLESREV